MHYTDIAESWHSLHLVLDEMKEKSQEHTAEPYDSWSTFARLETGMSLLKGELRKLDTTTMTERDRQIFRLALAMVQQRMGGLWWAHLHDNLDKDERFEVPPIGT